MKLEKVSGLDCIVKRSSEKVGILQLFFYMATGQVLRT